MNSYEKGQTMTGTDKLVMRLAHCMAMISFNIKTTENLAALLIKLDNNVPL